LTSIPVLGRRKIELALPPGPAVDVVRDAFIAYARGEWSMPPKVYVTNYPAGDFRAMPALGGGHALLKWVTSFPGNPARGLPTVMGAVLLSNAATGELEALLDAGAVTALRTGAAAVLAAETLARPGASGATVIGAGVNGRAAARTFVARGTEVELWDVEQVRARTVAAEVGGRVASSREDALAADVVVTVTPGREVVLGHGSLRPGQHVSLMGADGPGKAEIAVDELVRTHLLRDDWEQAVTELTPEPRVRLFCDDWEQASHGGDLAHAVEAGLIGRDDVTDLGSVLTGAAPGRQHPLDTTAFDSTGLAIQDLAIAIACFERRHEFDLPTIDL
jgi:alanine dehydrogenase